MSTALPSTPRVAAAGIEVRGLSKVFEDGERVTTVFTDLALTIAPGSFVALAGPSGCGKSTLLRILAGLTEPTAGLALVDGREVRGTVPDGVAVVFQDYSSSLFPWLSVTKNIELAALALSDRRSRAARADELLAAVGLTGTGPSYPWQLSGGMQQRVAIARALVNRPRLLLLDEPFAAVDAQTRADLQDLIRTLWHEFGMTTILVTHDIDEAVYTSQRTLVLGGEAQGIILDKAIPLPAVRDQIATRATPEFAAARTAVLSAIRRPPTPTTLIPAWRVLSGDPPTNPDPEEYAI
jgi:NitT/TauT family transport system ATP-binding protein